MRGRGLHGYGSPRSRGLSFGSAGRTVNVWRISLGRLRGMQISHEAIYRSLFIQTRGVLKKALMAHLRTTRQMRQAKGGNPKSGLGQIVDTVSIRERPAEAKDRAVSGHWEGDLLTAIGRSFEPQGLARALIEPPRDPVQVVLREA